MDVVDRSRALGQHLWRWADDRWNDLAWWWTWQRFMALYAERVSPLLEQGLGCRDRWVEPGTPADEMLAWIDAQVASLTLPAPCIALSVILLAYTPAEWAAQPLAPTMRDAELPLDHLQHRWAGPLALWHPQGRVQVAAALEQPHAGLYVAVTGDSIALAAVMRGQTGRPSAAHAA